MSKKETREATVSSIFYPGKKEELKDTVRTFIEASEKTADDAQIILSPHAGYSYAGRFMGDAYKTASKRDINRVFIISRVHREPEKSVFLPEYTAFATPSGILEVDTEIVGTLLSSNQLFKTDNIPHTEEHSIEVQLPFIQYLWPKAQIVPVLTGFPSLPIAKKLASALKEAVLDNLDSTLFVVSSNLSAYDHLNDAESDTNLFLELLEQQKWEEFPHMLDKGKINACSADALTALYFLFNGKLKHKVLSHSCDGNSMNNSKKKASEKRVCFGAISFYNR